MSPAVKVLSLMSYEMKVFTIDVRCGKGFTVLQLMSHKVKVLSLMSDVVEVLPLILFYHLMPYGLPLISH